MNWNSKIGGYLIGKPQGEVKKKQGGNLDHLPPVVDLRSYMTYVEEQVGNSCVANAFAGAYEYLVKRHLGESADVSRLFIYYNARAESETEGEDVGSFMYAAIDGLKKHGACAEELWENFEDMILEEPSVEAYEQASQFKIAEAEFIDTDLELWKETLAEGYPIAFALNTFESFDEASHKKGKVSMPKKSDNVRETHGWHAMLCVGYSDRDKRFIVRNSWGEEWGDNGYCYIPYKYVIDEEFNGHDSWIIKSVTDLEFDKDLWIEDDSSYLSEDDSTFIYDFYIALEEESSEDFITNLEHLCLDYAIEEDYYFDYDWDEEASILYVDSLEIITEDEEAFLDSLETLCDEYANEGDYDYEIEGFELHDEEEEYDDDEDW